MPERQMPRAMRLVMGSRVMPWMQRAAVGLYRRTGGKVGGTLRGAPVCLLTTRGRKSGQPRTAPLLYIEDGDDVIVVASKGGWPSHPLWYLNLVADPEVTLQIGDDVRPMTARTANADERARLWQRVVSMYDDYANYQSWTDREIPVVICSPRA
jgi:deazaflavin-dependent oxidoreductase (nitroreductase family)